MADDPLAVIRARALARMAQRQRARERDEQRRRWAADRVARDRKFEQELAEARESRRQLRRSEERLKKKLIEADYTYARAKSTIGNERVPIAVVKRFHDMRVAQLGIVVPDDAPWIDIWRRDATDEAKRFGVTIRWTPECAGLNGYALRASHENEVPPVTSLESYLTCKHENWHHGRPCEPSHRIVKVDALSSVCPRCELNSWLSVIPTVKPYWNRRMHDHMARCLRTYRPYGTPGEQAEIDRLTSGIGFREIQLQKAGRA